MSENTSVKVVKADEPVNEDDLDQLKQVWKPYQMKQLHKAIKVLQDICKTNNYPDPVYKFLEVEEKELKHTFYHNRYIRRDYYKYHLMVGEDSFFGESVSRRLAKRVVAYEAIKLLRFKKMGYSAKELNLICDEHGLPPPQFMKDTKDNTYLAVVEQRDLKDDNLVFLIGKGTGDTIHLMMEAAAKNALDQFIKIFEYKSYE